MDIFWTRMEEEVGNVAVHIKNIINFQELAATKALGNLTEPDIFLIEEQMRIAVPRIRRLIVSNGKDIREYYGSYSDEPTEFRFSVGDVRIFQTIVEAVKQLGIQNLLTPKCSSGLASSRRLGQVDFDLDRSRGQETEAIRTRLRFHLNEATLSDQNARLEEHWINIDMDPVTPNEMEPDIDPFANSSSIVIDRQDDHASQHDDGFSTGVISELLIEPAGDVGFGVDEQEDVISQASNAAHIESDASEEDDSAIQESCDVRNDDTRSSNNSKTSVNLQNAMNDSAFLKTLTELHDKTKDTDLHARRYNNLEKDLCTFEYLTAGNAHYEFINSNLATMSKKTIQRHMHKNTIHIQEGIIDVHGLKTYLVKNAFPLTVVLCEDATKITSATNYDHNTDSITGLVPPMDSNGLPQQGMFRATSPYKMASDLQSYHVGSYAYVQIAIPLTREAAPYVIYHACSNNQFDYNDVLKRWAYTESLLKRHGITVLANASDGDSRLMKAMRIRAGFDRPCSPSTWGPWFRIDCFGKTPINVQDMIHTINKFRNRMLKGDMAIGKYIISKEHLKQLINNHSKDKHKLCISDIDLKDKMKFGPTLKLINPELIEFLEKNVPHSKGTALFLNLMHRMYRSYVEADVPFLERVEDIWTTVFIVRGWRNYCKKKYKNLTECITTNAYHCLELDAHALILFICLCRDNNAPEQCIMEYLSSQPCEELFRELRSMSSTNQTVVNFSIKELTEKLRRIYMKRCIMYKHRDHINFPYLNTKRQNQSCLLLPSNDDIEASVAKCKTNAKNTLLSLGIERTMIDMSDSVLNHVEIQRSEFIGVDVEDSSEDEYLKHASSNEQDDARCDDDFTEDSTTVYNAAELFSNCDELKLKSSASGLKHTFKISDSSGQIKNVKKSTLLWMLTEGRHRLSTDRVRRFQQN